MFLDEFDVVAKLRNDKNELGELKRVVNSLIQNIDAFSNDSLLIAATNHHELLDAAVWRRFSRIINLEKPHKDEIKSLLRIFFGDINNSILGNDKRMAQLEMVLEGFSHSDINTVVTNTIKHCIVHECNDITICDLLKEVYFQKNHNTGSEDDFLRYLIQNNIPHKEINESLNIPLRKIQNLSKKQLKVD